MNQLNISYCAVQTSTVSEASWSLMVLKLLEMNNIAPPIDDTKFCKILLYGHVPLLDITNKKIILHTIYYIKCTKRFDTLEAFNQ